MTRAVVFEEPGQLSFRDIRLPSLGASDVRVEVCWTGISTGTEKLLWEGRMPPFPGLGYPLVPGYETVGQIVDAGEDATNRIGEQVFVAGARCYGDVHGLFGGAASHLVVPADKAIPLDPVYEERATLLALAATAYHALAAQDGGTMMAPDLIVGHGVVGRLLARLTVALGHPSPTVWETASARRDGADGYEVIDPQADATTSYRRIVDASGDAAVLDTLIAKLAPAGQIVLAGFYSDRVSFAFPPAFMREMRMRIAAEWQLPDMVAVKRMVDTGELSLNNLITHRVHAADAGSAYAAAFSDPNCLKMVLDWRQHAE